MRIHSPSFLERVITVSSSGFGGVSGARCRRRMPSDAEECYNFSSATSQRRSWPRGCTETLLRISKYPHTTCSALSLRCERRRQCSLSSSHSPPLYTSACFVSFLFLLCVREKLLLAARKRTNKNRHNCKNTQKNTLRRISKVKKILVSLRSGSTLRLFTHRNWFSVGFHS